jgi:hypothetical protein
MLYTPPPNLITIRAMSLHHFLLFTMILISCALPCHLVPRSYSPTIAPLLAPLHTVLFDPLKTITRHPALGVTSPYVSSGSRCVASVCHAVHSKETPRSLSPSPTPIIAPDIPVVLEPRTHLSRFFGCSDHFVPALGGSPSLPPL